MFFNRRKNKKISALQFEFRRLKLELLDANILGLNQVKAKLDEIHGVCVELASCSAESTDDLLFSFLEATFAIAKFKAASLIALRDGEGNQESLRSSYSFHLLNQREIADSVPGMRPSVESLCRLSREACDCVLPKDYLSKVSELALVQLPFVDSLEMKPKAQRETFGVPVDESEEQELEPLLLSVQFKTDNETWANPQVVKPNMQYAIKGTIKLNRIPENFSRLIIKHVSTSGSDFFSLALPEIPLTGSHEYHVDGHVVFKYVQSSFDPPVAIRLVGQFVSNDGRSLLAELIGYDELIAQVADENSFKYPTGYRKLNRRAWEIGTELKNKLPEIDQEEFNDFMVLLSAILNYAGYCADHGVYKGKKDVKEDSFRDMLIAYLCANPTIAGNIIKEGNVAGGRVEIRFKNIIAELKVEKKISDRVKMLEQYIRQPSVYGSAVSAEIAILCVLDVTEKKNSPAPAHRNVFLSAAELHGFEDSDMTSMVAVIVIDANLKNPSSY